MEPKFLSSTVCCLALVIVISLAAPAFAQWQYKLDSPTSLAFSPDSKTLATGNIIGWLEPGDLCLWRVSDGKLLHKVRYFYGVQSLAFSPNGKTLAVVTMTSGDKDSVRLWDVASWRTKNTLGSSQYIYSIDYSPNGKRLILGSNMGENGEIDSATLWNIGQRFSRDLPRSQGLSTMRFSPDGQVILGAFYSGYYNDDSQNLRAWNVNGRFLWRHAQPHLTDVVWLPDGRSFLAGVSAPFEPMKGTYKEQSGALQVRDAKTGEVTRSLSQSVPVTALAISSDGKTWATGGADGSVRLWNARTRQFARMLKPHRSTIVELEFSPDGRFLASASNGRDADSDDSVRLTKLD